MTNQAIPPRYSELPESFLSPQAYKRLITHCAQGPLKFNADRGDLELLNHGLIEVYDPEFSFQHFWSSEEGQSHQDNHRYPHGNE